jgi:hypothetical protein
VGKRGPTSRPAEELRRHHIACRLTDSELKQLDQGKPEGVTRGEWLRRKALARRLPAAIPAINAEAWRVMSKAAGNLATIGTALRSGDRVDPEKIRSEVAAFRLALIGAGAEEEEQG